MTKTEAEKEVKSKASSGAMAGNCPPRCQPNGAYWHRAGRSFKMAFAFAPEILPRFVEIKQIEDAIGGVVDQQYASVVDHSFQLTWQF